MTVSGILHQPGLRLYFYRASDSEYRRCNDQVVLLDRKAVEDSVSEYIAHIEDSNQPHRPLVLVQSESPRGYRDSESPQLLRLVLCIKAREYFTGTPWSLPVSRTGP